VATAKHNLGRALEHQDRLTEALTIETEAVEAFVSQGDGRLESAARSYLSSILMAHGDLVAAETQSREALRTVQAAARPSMLARLASVLLRQGRPSEALIAAREAHVLLETLGGVEEGESHVRLVFAESLRATGDHDAACAAIRRARDRVRERADQITDAAWRASFLENLPENARTLEVARDMLSTTTDS
jgi:tetratricopeptide (TPR) repeat protein